MKSIKVLGTGCANCRAAMRLIEDVARTEGVAVELVKVEDPAAIVAYGILSTPGVVVDGKVVRAGGVPTRDEVRGWLA